MSLKSRICALAALVCLAGPVSAADIIFAGFDGTRWALWSTDGGGAATRLLDREVRGPVLAGGHLVFADPSGRIWHRRDGADPVELTGLPRPCDQPTIAPDLTRIVVACFRFSNRQDDGALYQVDLATGATSLLYDGPGLQKSPAFSPDGAHLAFVSGFRLSADRVIEHIWIADSDGSNDRPVEDRSDINIDPAWLDADTVIFSSDIDGSGITLWTKGIDGGKIGEFTRGEADFAATAADNDAGAFVGFDGDAEALFLRDPDGRRQVLSLPGIEGVRDPSWVRK